jgi:8-oxo-dGTP pyrophosphatase MutT (NUDIX family)
MKELGIIDLDHIPEEDIFTLRVRHAARAIVIDDEGKIALLHVKSRDYYKLPGGGVEVGEDYLSALKRECREEIGCEIEVMGEVGSVLEYRKKFNLKQESVCYLVRVCGEKGKPSFTLEEKEMDFVVVWAPFSTEIRLTEGERLNDYEGNFIVQRDALFLAEARNQLHR